MLHLRGALQSQQLTLRVQLEAVHLVVSSSTQTACTASHKKDLLYKGLGKPKP